MVRMGREGLGGVVPAASSLVSGILAAATFRLRTPLSNVNVDIFGHGVIN